MGGLYAAMVNSTLDNIEQTFAGIEAGAGDYLTFKIAGESLFYVRERDRDRDGEVRSFYNVCQHRAHQMVQGRGNARVVVCPYGAWICELTGGLRAGRGGKCGDPQAGGAGREIAVEEDIRLVESVQRGLKSRGYVPGPLVLDPDCGLNSEHSIATLQKWMREVVDGQAEMGR